MGTTSIQKHFLDTSVVRPLLLGTDSYKQYLKSQFKDEPCYISRFVQMEIKRSFLINIMSFYFMIRLNTMPTVSDALKYWSNKFKTSELKAIIQLAAVILRWRDIDFNSTADKPKALRELGRYIKRIECKLRRYFKDIGRDSTRCARAAIPLKADPSDIATGFKNFFEAFNDEETCKTKCRIDRFLLERYPSEIRKYVLYADEQPTNNDTKGFKKISEKLKGLLEKGTKLCSCRLCESIGDAVIALDSPRNMILEHIDKAFDYLCPIIKQPHKKHRPEISF